MGEWGSKRGGVSPVIASIIISAVVLTIGGALWSYTQSASTVIANDYIDGVMILLTEASERFAVEKVSNNSDCSILRVWIYNYGDVNVTVDVYVYIGSYVYFTDPGDPILVEAGAYRCANVTISASSGDEVAVKAHSRRQNNAYYVYTVP